MKDVIKALVALVLFALGVGVIVLNIHTLTVTLLAFAGPSMLLALLLAFLSDMKAIGDTVLPFIPVRWRGGDEHHV